MNESFRGACLFLATFKTKNCCLRQPLHKEETGGLQQSL